MRITNPSLTLKRGVLQQRSYKDFGYKEIELCVRGILTGRFNPVLCSDWLTVHNHKQSSVEIPNMFWNVSEENTAAVTMYLTVKDLKVQIPAADSTKHLNLV